MHRTVTHALGIRPGETALVAAVSAVFLVTQAGHGLGSNTADALFFLRFGVEFLPYLFIAAGALTIAAALLYGMGLGRFGHWEFLTALPALLAVVLVAERLAIGADLRWLYALVWLTETLVIFLTFTLMWAVAARVCDTRQAKRLFPLFASAGIAGGMLGNLATGPLAATLGTEALLLVHAGLLVLAAVLVKRVARLQGSGRDADRRVDHGSGVDDLRTGARITLQSRLLTLVSLAAVVLAVLWFMVVFEFSQVVATSLDSEARVAGFLGLFAGAAIGVSFAVSLLIANRLFARIGVVRCVLLLPLIYLAGNLLWLAGFNLATATAVRGAQWIVFFAVFGTAWSALFNVVEPRRRGQVLAFVNGGPQQVGMMLGGVVLLASGALLTPAQRFGLGAVLALIAVVLVWRMRDAYRIALLDAVRIGVVDVFGVPHRTVAQAAGSAEAAAAVAAAAAHGPARTALVERTCERIGRIAHLQHLRAAVRGNGQDPAAQRYLERVLGQHIAAEESSVLSDLGELSSPEHLRLIARGLRADDPEIRSQALEALETLGEPRVTRRLVAQLEGEPDTTAGALLPALQTLLDDPDEWLRALAARVMADHLRAEWSALAARASADPSRVVAAALPAPPPTRGAAVTDTLDRMLFLQQVPMFADLAPADLERIAAIATERAYPAGTVIYREGDPGDGMLLIAEGTVRVSHPGEGQPVIRRYGAGEHVGELALLRGRPRSADVVAEVEVRGLVLPAAEFKAILSERPQAALAMLATLAERLGTVL